MKTRLCSYPRCGERRIHYTRNEERGQQTVEVEDDYPDCRNVYCSIECAVYDGNHCRRKYEVEK